MAPTSTEERAPQFAPDILGEPYSRATMRLRPDDEGEVVATLVRRPADTPGTNRAVLHVHGFADYFFQTAAADYWCSRGFDFYAVDLRKYGRSLLPHQTPNYVDSLSAYYEELDEAYGAIAANYADVVLSAHSTGGLTVPLWAADRRVEAAALVLNAPWLDMHGDLLTRRIAMPAIRRLGAHKPMLEIPRKVDGIYAQSIHRDFAGEWAFNLDWKPLQSWPIFAGWVRAIREGQIRVARGLGLTAPILVLSSARSGHPRSIKDPDAHSTDIVLDVEQIRRRAPLLGRRVTLAQIDGALHDVTLSAKPVRDTVFAEVDRFLSAYVTR